MATVWWPIKLKEKEIHVWANTGFFFFFNFFEVAYISYSFPKLMILFYPFFLFFMSYLIFILYTHPQSHTYITQSYTHVICVCHENSVALTAQII